MKKITFMIGALSIIAMVSTCKKTPGACIKASKSTAVVNEQITFTSCSTDADENEFFAYDGTSATGASSSNAVVVGSFDPCSGTSVTYKFIVAGTYTIELKAKNRTKGDCNNGEYKWDKTTTIVTINP